MKSTHRIRDYKEWLVEMKQLGLSNIGLSRFLAQYGIIIKTDTISKFFKRRAAALRQQRLKSIPLRPPPGFQREHANLVGPKKSTHPIRHYERRILDWKEMGISPRLMAGRLKKEGVILLADTIAKFLKRRAAAARRAAKSSLSDS